MSENKAISVNFSENINDAGLLTDVSIEVRKIKKRKSKRENK
jgi:hypothetical protein